MSAAPTIDIPTKADLLIAAYMRAGYARLSPAILQPAEPFLDLSGEDMRRHMYLVTDAAGRELCLRPDLTIPVARHYLDAGAPAQPANFCYLGAVFRDHGDAAGEFLQAGIESFGNRDTAAADAEMLARGLAATAHYGIAAPDDHDGRRGAVRRVHRRARTGAGVEAPLAQGFQRPAAQARYLGDAIDNASGTGLEAPERGARQGRDNDQGVLAAFANANPKAAQALVTDLLSIAGMTTVGGRSIEEIADRFVEQAELGFSTGLPGEIRALIERFLAIAGSPDEAAAALRALQAEAKISLGAALDLFERRNAFLAARGDRSAGRALCHRIRRGVDYYTGFVFELHDPHDRAGGPWWRAAAMTACSPGLAAGRRSRRSALRSGSNGSRACGGASGGER